MKNCNRKTSITIRPGFCFLLALALLNIPLPWVVAWLTAMFVHEFGHYIMLFFCKCPIYNIELTAMGALIHTECSGKKSTLCALAGPLCGLLLTLGIRWVPRIAVCAFAQSTCNLLPVYPLDGGQVLRSLLQSKLREESAKKLVNSISLGTIAFILLSVLILPKNIGGIVILFATLLLFRSGAIKIPCKECKIRVQ